MTYLLTSEINKIFESWRRYLKESDGYYPQVFNKLKEYFEDYRKALASNKNDEAEFEEIIYNFIEFVFDNTTSIHDEISGSFRTVFLLSEDFAFKVANTPSGIIQNEQEVYIGRDSKFSKFFPKVYEADEQFYWLLVERVKPLQTFSDIKVHWSLQNVISNIRHGSNVGRWEEIWTMMNWVISELIKMGGITEKNIDIFLGKVLESEGQGGTFGHERFFQFFIVQGVYKKFQQGLTIRDSTNLDDPRIKELLNESLKYLIDDYYGSVRMDQFTKSIIQLAVELPNIEIWDFAPRNLGIREETGQIVILDSSFDITKSLKGSF
jgi:hypothetical protein